MKKFSLIFISLTAYWLAEQSFDLWQSVYSQAAVGVVFAFFLKLESSKHQLSSKNKEAFLAFSCLLIWAFLGYIIQYLFENNIVFKYFAYILASLLTYFSSKFFVTILKRNITFKE